MTHVLCFYRMLRILHDYHEKPETFINHTGVTFYLTNTQHKRVVSCNSFFLSFFVVVNENIL